MMVVVAAPAAATMDVDVGAPEPSQGKTKFLRTFSFLHTKRLFRTHFFKKAEVFLSSKETIYIFKFYSNLLAITYVDRIVALIRINKNTS